MGLALASFAACAEPMLLAASVTTIDRLTPAPASTVRERAGRRLALAAAYFEQGQDAVALQEVRAALQIDPTDAQSFNLLGLIHQRQQAPELAEQSFEQALRMARAPAAGSELASVQHNYGWFLCERAQYAKGQSLLQEALAQPSYAQKVKTWVVMGDCQQRAGQIAQAQQSWQRALAIEPHNPWLRQRLGDTVAAPSSTPRP